MDKEKVILQNIKEFVVAAKREKNEGLFNSASTLFFKALAISVDLFILKKEGYIPNNHTQRFKLLKDKYPALYQILDKDFPIYQDSYRLKISKELVEVIENDLKKITEITGLELN